MQTVIQLTLISIQIGSVYVMFSLGLTLVFGVMRIINFVHGHFFAVSALMVAWSVPLIASQGAALPFGYLVAVIIGLAVALTLGTLVYVFGLRFFQRDMTGSFILSMGMGLLLDGIFLKVFGGAPWHTPTIISGSVSILGTAVTIQRLALCGTAVLITALLYLALTSTKRGKALRAVAIDHEAAMLQGVPYQQIAFWGFLVATGLAALAGGLIAPVTVITPTLGEGFLVKAFIAVIVGGLGSLPGAVVGSLFVAVIETVGGYYFDQSTALVAIFLLSILVLLVRPTGLMGRA